MPKEALQRPSKIETTIIDDDKMKAVKQYADLYDLSEEEALGQLAKSGIDYVVEKVRRAIK